MLELTRWKPKGSTYPQLLSPDSLRPTTDTVSKAQHSQRDRGARDTMPSHPHWDKGKMSRNQFVPHDSQKSERCPQACRRLQSLTDHQNRANQVHASCGWRLSDSRGCALSTPPLGSCCGLRYTSCMSRWHQGQCCSPFCSSVVGPGNQTRIVRLVRQIDAFAH